MNMVTSQTLKSMINQVLLRFDKFQHETQKAYLIKIGSTEHWLPKRFCKRFITNKKLGGNVTIPAWLYEKVTGIAQEDIPMEDATVIVEKHIPSPVAAIETLPHQNLIK